MRANILLLPGIAILLAAMLPVTAAASTAARTATMPFPARAIAPGANDSTGVDLPYGMQVTFGRPACDTCPPRVCPDEPVLVTVSGSLPDGCVHFRGLRELAVGSPFAVLTADFVVDSCDHVCTLSPVPFSGQVAMQPMGPGLQMLRLIAGVRVCPDTTLVARAYARMLTYEVLPECHIEPSPDSLARMLTTLRIVPERRCSGDSLTLQLLTNGCPPCVHLTSLSRTRVRGYVATLDWRPLCLNLVCRPETLSLALGQMMAGSYWIRVATDVHVLDTPNPDSTISFERTIAFEVPRTCDSTIVGCLHGQLPPLGTPIRDCSLRVPPGGRGDVLVPVRNDLRGQGVAGVEGDVSVFGPFHVVDLQYAGSSPGVHVSWRPDGPISRFVVFGASSDVVPAGVSDLLRVSVVADSAVPPGLAAGELRGQIRVASGPDGEAVPLCPEPDLVSPGLRLCIDSAALGCDVNDDGHADVRDLVLMTRCLRRTPADSTGRPTCYDCDGDGIFGIPDLFCCAHEILRGPGVPRDSSHVHEGLAVTMDPPAHKGDAVSIRVRVRGAGALGAVLLRLRYPADRWQLQPLPEADEANPPGWLPLADAGEAGLLRLGALRLADPAADELVFEFRAVPLGGAAGGGTLTVEGADLTSPDGAAFQPAAALPSAELSGVPASEVELSPVRPNPFTRTATFSVSLPREAEVDLAVHDLAGRRVATLAHGRLAAGRRDFTWNGDGAHSGVYFVRLRIDGRVLSTRAALLRDGR